MCACQPEHPKAVFQSLATQTNAQNDLSREIALFPMYQILTDRFALGNGQQISCIEDGKVNLRLYCGGNWQGIQERADYLADLGIRSVWISPVFKNISGREEIRWCSRRDETGICVQIAEAEMEAYHGYWQQDLQSLNPHFGDSESLKAMITALHERGIAVIIDLVFNHLGPLGFYDCDHNGLMSRHLDPLLSCHLPMANCACHDEIEPFYFRNGDYRSIFAWRPGRTPPPPFDNLDFYTLKGVTPFNWNDPESITLGDYPTGLLNLRTGSPEVQSALISSFLPLIDAGADGFRLDAASMVSPEDWQSLIQPLKHYAKEAYGKDLFVVAEFSCDFSEGSGLTLQACMLQNEKRRRESGVDAVLDFAFRKAVEQVFLAGENVTIFEELRLLPVAQGRHLGFISNHDFEGRFLGRARQLHQIEQGDAALAILKASLVLLILGSPSPVVYYGDEQEYDGLGDPESREPIWLANVPYDTEKETYRHLRNLIQLRTTYPVFGFGDRRMIAQAPASRILVIESHLNQQRAIVAINTGDQVESLRLPETSSGWMKLSGEGFTYEGETVELGSYAWLVLRESSPEGEVLHTNTSIVK
jgi:glycosidase